MNKRIFYIVTLLISSLLHSQAMAQNEIPEPIGKNEKNAVVDSIIKSYYPWSEISMSGKLSSSMLPLSPSVKVYMQRGSLIVISVAAPLIGEVARIEIDKEEALIVNKMSNRYTTVSSELMESFCPGGLEALQNLLLGRITILGRGELSRQNADKIEVYSLDGMEWMLLPDQDIDNGDFVYVYFADMASYLLDRFLVVTRIGGGNVEAAYEWGKKDMTLTLNAELRSGNLQASLKLNNPDSSPKKISRIQLNSKYSKVDLYGILKM